MNQNTIFIVDDDAAIREALSLMIEQENMCVQTFCNAQDFLTSYQADSQGCVVLDIRMDGMDGMKLHKRLVERDILLPVIFLTGHGDIPMSVQAMKDGAVDFLTKPVTRDKLMSAIRAATQLFETKKFHKNNHIDALSRLSDLTQREKDVMLLAVQGLPNKHIARQLGISHRTVEIHKSKIMTKTGAVNLLDLSRIVQNSHFDI
jgi:FixJ family two-component response regulator